MDNTVLKKCNNRSWTWLLVCYGWLATSGVAHAASLPEAQFSGSIIATSQSPYTPTLVSGTGLYTADNTDQFGDNSHVSLSIGSTPSPSITLTSQATSAVAYVVNKGNAGLYTSGGLLCGNAPANCLLSYSIEFTGPTNQVAIQVNANMFASASAFAAGSNGDMYNYTGLNLAKWSEYRLE